MPTEWPKHFCRAGQTRYSADAPPDNATELRKVIEPWLSAVFQSEHLSLLLGSGFTAAIAHSAGVGATGMGSVEFKCAGDDKVDDYARETAARSGRGEPNIEDQIRAALTLISGLEVLKNDKVDTWRAAVDRELRRFLESLLKTESEIAAAIGSETDAGAEAMHLLLSFLMSFASRTASRERLNLFTTNYDRLVEYGCDLAGLRIIDRFVGALTPVFRSSRINVDMHYNPPGIRGEPRYLEGVIRLTKIHGSLDWRFENSTLRRYALPFGAPAGHPDLPSNPANCVMVYPNPAKDVETIEYPYAELFRDFAAALCRPNSVLVTYGYGFGDDHVNRIIADMLKIPSTHLVIISFDDPGGRISRFCRLAGRPDAQISVLLGSHFGDLATIVDHYLPKPAIDEISARRTRLMENRGERPADAEMATEGTSAESGTDSMASTEGDPFDDASVSSGLDEEE